MSLTPAQERARQALREDFDLYARKCLTIRTKDGDLKPLVLNQAQRYFCEKIEEQLRTTGRIRVIILKGRQQGLSTVVGGRLIFRTTQGRGKRALVVAHKADASATLFTMTRRYYSHLPEIVKPHAAYSSKKELDFDNLQSSYVVATAGGDGVLRGDTIQYAHLSEVAFWPANSAAENFNGLIQTVPEADGTEVYIESTANGVSGIFYEQWNEAVAGTSGFLPIFIPWFWQDEYRTEPPKDFQRTPDEDDLAGIYGLDDAQLFWRRQRISRTSLDLFRQEYPCSPEEAFISTGRPLFDQEGVLESLRVAPDPVARLGWFPGAGFEPDPRGELLVYAEPDPTRSYFIGVDVALGVEGGDYSVAQVLDDSGAQVATYRTHVHPDPLADVLLALGRMYNDAQIAIESNNHGILPLIRLSKDLLYPNLYSDETRDKETDQQTTRLGFQTNVKTKSEVINKARAAFRAGELVVRDVATLKEMRTFVVNEKGKMEAEVGKFDDCVMSLAIANHICERRFDPVEMPDEDYRDPAALYGGSDDDDEP